MPDKLPPHTPSPTSLPDTVSRLSEIKGLLRQSVGKLPARLVFIFIFGVVLALLTGVAMQTLHHDRPRFEWLPLRLTVNPAEPVLEMESFKGEWVIKTDKADMSIQFKDTKFEWIIAMHDEGFARYYARGNFRTEGNVLILSQRPDFGHPFDRAHPSRPYIPFTMTNFNSFVTMGKREMRWVVPVSEQQNFNPRRQGIFDRSGDATFVWTKN